MSIEEVQLATKFIDHKMCAEYPETAAAHIDGLIGISVRKDVDIKKQKDLLVECLSCLNEMPNRYIKERFMTYDLAAKIETLLRS